MGQSICQSKAINHCTPKLKHKLVFGIFVVWVIQEGAVSEHDGVLKLAAHWEGVAYDSPLQSACRDCCEDSTDLTMNSVKTERHAVFRQPASYLGFIPKSHNLSNIVDQAHQLEPVCAGTVRTEYQTCTRLSACPLGLWFCLSTVPLSGCAWRMPSAVWKAWKELGKSTSGSDSSTSWSNDRMASIIPI